MDQVYTDFDGAREDRSPEMISCHVTMAGHSDLASEDSIKWSAEIVPLRMMESSRSK